MANVGLMMANVGLMSDGRHSSDNGQHWLVQQWLNPQQWPSYASLQIKFP